MKECKNLFTPEAEQDIQESNILTIHCERCDYKLMLLVNWNSWKGVTEGIKRHMKESHGIKIQ